MYSMGAMCEWLLPRVCVGGCACMCACTSVGYMCACLRVHMCVTVSTCVHVCGYKSVHISI